MKKISFYNIISNLFRQKRGRRLTIEGLLFIIATFSIGFASFNTGDNSLYLILSLMLSFLIFSGFLSTSNLKRMNIQRFVPSNITAKQDIKITLKISNLKKILPVYSLETEDFLDNGNIIGVGFAMKIPKNNFISLNYITRFKKRGIWQFDKTKISSRFPFGFFQRSLTLNLKEEVIVYPETTDVSDIVALEKYEMGDIESNKKGVGSNIYGLREYEVGDNAKHIHWKTSAKKDILMVREFENEERKKVSIILLNYVNKYDILEKIEDKFEKAVIYAASFATYFIQKDYQVEMITVSGKIPFGNGIYHLHRILRSLAIVDIKMLEETDNNRYILTNFNQGSKKIVIKADSSLSV